MVKTNAWFATGDDIAVFDDIWLDLRYRFIWKHDYAYANISDVEK